MLNIRNGLQVDSVHNLWINSDVLIFCKGNAGYIDRETGTFQRLNIVNEINKISLLSGLTNFKTTVVKFYLIRPKNDDPNNTSKTKHDDEKNGYEEDYLSIAGPITGDLILAIMVILPVSADFLIGWPDDHNCKTISPLLAGKNSN